MAVYEVIQPDGHTYHIRRSNQNKMQFDMAGMTPEQIELLAKIEATKNDGTTAPLPERRPGQHREFHGRNTSWLRDALRVLGLDGWG